MLTLSLPDPRMTGDSEYSAKSDDKMDFLLFFLFTRNNYTQEITTTSNLSGKFDSELSIRSLHDFSLHAF